MPAEYIAACLHVPAPRHKSILPACRRLSPTSKLNWMLNNNLRLFNPEQRAQLQTLASGRRKHLLRHWPAPGRRDDVKRALVAKAAAGAPSGELEAARLGALV